MCFINLTVHFISYKRKWFAMTGKKTIFVFVILSVGFFLINIFCGDPIQPEFNFQPEIADNSIKAIGKSVESSYFILFIHLDQGDEPVTYQWLKNGSVMPGDTIDSLYFEPLKLTDSGEYRCIAKNSIGIDTSDIYPLIVTAQINDTVKPDIQLISPQDSSVISDTSVPLIFKVTDSSGIALVTVNNDTITSPDSMYTDTIEFEKDTTFFTIIAIDKSNNANSDTLHLTYIYDSTFVDSIKPVITLISPQDGAVLNDSLLNVQFSVTDKGGLSEVTLNDCTVISSNTMYTAAIKLNEGTNTITLKAVDNSDNIATLIFSVTYNPGFVDTIPPVVTLLFPQDSATTASVKIEVRYLVKDESGISYFSINGTEISSSDSIYRDSVTLDPGANEITAEAVDASIKANKNRQLSTFFYDSTALDTIPPTITLNAPSQGTQTNIPSIDIDVDVDDFSGVAWVTIDGDTVEPSRENYKHTVKLSSGINSIVVMAVDNSSSMNKDSLIVKVIYDNETPVVKLLDSSINNSTIGSSSKRVHVIAKDNFGITSVTFSIGIDNFTPTKQNDSTWYADITGLQADIFNTITITAEDSAHNSETIQVKIKYDPTIEDKEPPAMTQKNGPVNGERVTSAEHTIQFSISDDNDVAAAWYTLDGVKEDMTHISGDIYECSINLGTTYGERTINIWAKDNSTNQNQGSTSITWTYNTAITAVTNSTPTNGESGVSLNPTLQWNGGEDPDGDAVTYTIYYGTSSNNLDKSIDAGTNNSVAVSSALTESTKYYWKVTAYSATYPEDSISSNVTSFTTVFINDPPVLVSVSDQTINEDSSIMLTMSMVTATDVDNTQDELSLIIVNGSHYSVNGNQIVPEKDYDNDLIVPLKVFDGEDESNLKNMTITIKPVNDAPVLNEVTSQTTDEDTPITITMDMVTATDVDNSQAELSLSIENGNNYTVDGSKVTPSSNYFGSLNVPVKVNDGTDESNSKTMTIEVTPVNDAPTISYVAIQDEYPYPSDNKIQFVMHFNNVEGYEEVKYIRLYVNGSQKLSTTPTSNSDISYVWEIIPQAGVLGDYSIKAEITDNGNLTGQVLKTICLTGSYALDEWSAKQILSQNTVSEQYFNIIFSKNNDGRIDGIFMDPFSTVGEEITKVTDHVQNLTELEVFSFGAESPVSLYTISEGIRECKKIKRISIFGGHISELPWRGDDLKDTPLEQLNITSTKLCDTDTEWALWLDYWVEQGLFWENWIDSQDCD